MKLLVTRPEIDQQQTVQALKDLGVVAISSPLMDIVPLDFSLPVKDWQAVIVTSRNSLRLLDPADLEGLIHRPLFCVGSRTAQLARTLGFTDIRTHGQNSDALIDMILESLHADNGPLLYLAGKFRAGRLQDVLQTHAFEISLLEVYEARARNRLTEDAANALRERSLDGVLLYSERSCRLLLSLLEREELAEFAKTIIYYCLSEAVAFPLRQLGYPLVVAKVANETSLLDCVRLSHN
ncbi:uroporphyrinogen-III synthase [uncultured Cohaesibacter sp.]|uniref:uroporphyrinogen-III synthase n=1 Tax=uncultured Cohaesibacter sp. TaxID=1002546 RepID=UPI0029319F7E|nr:uroporphyrinogen-III synthase [uncultured Cohaesibacter sp.]